MNIVRTELPGCSIIEADRHFDDRGFFQELFEQSKYAASWKQVNWSSSKRNVLRGIHVAEYIKLVTCVSGHIWDMVVDLRPNSPTYLHHIGVELSADQSRQVYIPAGCGHGFVSLEDNSCIVYMQTERYAELGEQTVMYNDPTLAINWPGENHIISDRDRNGTLLT